MDDPGWSGVWPSALWGLIPMIGLHHVRRTRGIEPLRATFVAYMAGVVLFAIPLAFVALHHASGATTTACVGAVLVAGVVCIAAITMFQRRPLDASSPATLADTFRSNFFLKLALAEFIALVGFTLTFVSGRFVVYPVAVALSLVAFAVAAPTRADITRRQHEIGVSGSPLDLLQVLQTEPWKRRGFRS